MLAGGCQVTWIVWPRPHSNSIPTCDWRRAGPQSRRAVSICLRCPRRLRGAGFCRSASRSVSGRVAADNAAVFTVKGRRSFKGVAREISVGGTMAGRPRILFPRLPHACCGRCCWVGGRCAASPLGNCGALCVCGGRGCMGKRGHNG